MSETVVCLLVAALAFGFGILAALLIKTIHQERKEDERDRSL